MDKPPATLSACAIADWEFGYPRKKFGEIEKRIRGHTAGVGGQDARELKCVLYFCHGSHTRDRGQDFSEIA